jgi:cbb3-type cytochrome oxidase subunit 3
MEISAIVTTVVMWLVFIGALTWCFSQVGKGGKWED